MYGHVQTRRQRILNFLSLIILGLFVIIGTVVLVLIAKGYEFDFSTREVVHNGLILIDSEPVSADVLLDDESTGENTPHRVTIPAGEHKITLQRDGFREWRREFDLSPGEVFWLSYPLLIPNTVQTSVLLRMSTIPVAEASPNSSLFASASGLTLQIVRADHTDEPVQTIDLAASVDGLRGAVKSIIWSDNNKQMLLTVTDGSSQRVLLVVLDGDQANVAEQSAELLHYTDLRFVPDHTDQLYGLQSNGLWLLNLADGAQIRHISEQVERYATFESAILTWSASSQRVVLHQGQRSIVLDAPPITELQDLTLSSHDHKLVAAFSSAQHGTTVVIEPGTAQQQVVTHPRAGSRLVFSPGAGYLLSHDGEKFQVYDFERHRFYTYELSVSRVGNIRWATTSQLVAITDDSQASMFDFDGSNFQNLAGGAEAAIILSPNQQHLLNFARSGADNQIILTDTLIGS